MVGKRQLLAVWGLVAVLAGVVLIQALLPSRGVAQGPGIAGRVTALETKLACVTTNVTTIGSTTGWEVVFEQCNVQIRSGLGSTAGGPYQGTTNGFGNLIIGYNEGIPALGRGGSHNLVIGPGHTYSSFGGLVAGSSNTISGPSASVTGGFLNTASGGSASVSGGFGNTASGEGASVSGGPIRAPSSSMPA